MYLYIGTVKLMEMHSIFMNSLQVPYVYSTLLPGSWKQAINKLIFHNTPMKPVWLRVAGRRLTKDGTSSPESNLFDANEKVHLSFLIHTLYVSVLSSPSIQWFQIRLSVFLELKKFNQKVE